MSVNPATATLTNVTAPGTYLLWAGVPDTSGSGAPFYFAAARVQIDTRTNLRFFLQTPDGNLAVDDQLEVGTATPGTAIFKIGVNQLQTSVAGVGNANSPNVCELTGFISATGVYILAANNLLNTHWSVSQVSWVTQSTVTPPVSGAASESPSLCALMITRPALRDSIRRKLGIIPPIDIYAGAVAGEEPGGQSYPSNGLINQAIADAIRTLNRETKFHSTAPVPIYLTAQTANGPLATSLQGKINSAFQNTINDVRRATWTDASGNVTRLYPKSYYDLDRRGNQFDNAAPSTPSMFFIEGYSLYLSPAPATAGTLTLYTGTALTQFCSDTDTLDQLPIDYMEVIEDLACYKLACMQPQDLDNQGYIKLYGASSAQGIESVKKWVASLNATQQPSLIAARFRTGSGTRRMRR